MLVAEFFYPCSFIECGRDFGCRLGFRRAEEGGYAGIGFGFFCVFGELGGLAFERHGVLGIDCVEGKCGVGGLVGKVIRVDAPELGPEILLATNFFFWGALQNSIAPMRILLPDMICSHSK